MTRKRFLLIIISVAALAIILRFVWFESDLIDRTPIVITSHESEVSLPSSYAAKGFTLTWDELYFADSYYVQVQGKYGDFEETFHAHQRAISIVGLTPNTYTIYVTGLYEDHLDARSAPLVITVKDWFLDEISRNPQSLSMRSTSFSHGIMTGGYLPEPFGEQDFVVVYRKADQWERVSVGDDFFIPVRPSGYLEFFSENEADEFVISVVSNTEITFPESVASIRELPVVDGLFVLERWQFTPDYLP